MDLERYKFKYSRRIRNLARFGKLGGFRKGIEEVEDWEKARSFVIFRDLEILNIEFGKV
jgi:uncharacterized protein YifE (UPF0438 family)